MIDIRKLRAFETALEKYTNNPVVDQIWNELEPLIIDSAKHISDLEEIITNLEYHKTNKFKYNILKEAFNRQLVLDNIERNILKCL